MDYWWRIIYRVALVLLAMVVPVGIACFFLPKCDRLRVLQSQKTVLEDENQRIEALTRELRAKQERFATDTNFVERTAREVGMAKSNEIVFRFTTPSASVAETNVETAKDRQPRAPVRGRHAARRAG
jgi:cell division protein FtsB